MRLVPRESEEQRRRRVVSRIRTELRVHVAQDLAEQARLGKLPAEWMTAQQLNRILEERGYWAAHPHVLAPFLSRSACEDVLAKALNMLACTHPDAWLRKDFQYRPAGRDWNEYAVQKANTLGRDFPQLQRTAVHSGAEGVSVLFGHDDYLSDARARHEVMLVRQFLRDSGIPELGFGLSDDGRTWVMVVWSSDDASLASALLDAWRTAFGAEQTIEV